MLRWAVRVVLWLHAGFWLMFAAVMVWAATSSPETLENAVFLQVLAGSGLSAVGAVGAAFYRKWGIVTALIGGIGVLVAWIAGDSGQSYRWIVVLALGLFALAAALDRRAFFTPAAR